MITKKIKLYLEKLDYVIIMVTTILVGIGLFCEIQAFMSSEEKNEVYIKHIAGIVLSYALIMVIIFIDYHLICSMSVFLYLTMIAILAFILVFGSDLNNVKRWIVIFGIQFQPSELTKVVLILFLAYLCNKFKNKLKKLYVLFILSAVVALPTVLIILEPHLSSSISILFIFFIIVYSSGISYKVIGKALALILPVVAVLIIGVMLFDLNIPFIEKYQVNRVLNFVADEEDKSEAIDFQQNQSIEAIGSGGLHGKMLATDEDASRKYSNIYAKESDFVFAIVGEEFGFLGSFFIVLLYAVLVIRCLIISSRAPDYMGRIICMGVSGYLMFQIFVNVGVATQLLPNTGLPLPFISYGLTSLISSMIAIGMVLNIGVRQKPKGEENKFDLKALSVD